MPLFETDMCTLQKFIDNEKIEGYLNDNYLILYNFAADCIYSASIQPELIRYLLPFYFKITEQAVILKNKIAIDIYCNFNSAIFNNQISFREAVGEKEFYYIMDYYIKQTIKKMEDENLRIRDWVSLFNTTVAFDKNNIILILKIIIEGSLSVKYSFLKYISVLLFKEGDDILVVNECEAFWTDDVWHFDSQVSGNFFWSKEVITYFDKIINEEKIETLFREVQPLLCRKLDSELVTLIGEEIKQSFNARIFYNRKDEYLQKMHCKSIKYKCWNRY